MTTQPENKDKAEQKVSKDELSEKELEKSTGGTVTFNPFSITRKIDKSSSVFF
jgi:type VI protein secretion system component Hcp